MSGSIPAGEGLSIVLNGELINGVTVMYVVSERRSGRYRSAGLGTTESTILFDCYYNHGIINIVFVKYCERLKPSYLKKFHNIVAVL